MHFTLTTRSDGCDEQDCDLSDGLSPPGGGGKGRARTGNPT